MKRFVAIYILCLLFLPLQGQEVFGYYSCPSSNDINTQWKRIPDNDTVLSVAKQKGSFFTKYVILYHDITVKFKIENDVASRIDSIGVHLEKLPSPHQVTFYCFPIYNDSRSRLGIGTVVPPAKQKSKSIQIEIFAESEYALNCPLEASHNALKTRKKLKRVYVYVERRGKGKYIKVSREKAIRMAEDENQPRQ